MSVLIPDNDLELLFHIAADPVRLLGAKSLALVEPFQFGYAAGLPVGATFGHAPSPDFEAFIRRRFPTPERWPDHMSAGGYVRFLAPDDASAFDLFVKLRREYADEHPPAVIESSVSRGPAIEQLLEAVRERPRMYFSGTPDVMACLVALVRGSIEAQHVHTATPSTAVLFDAFQSWMHARYSWALGRAWHRILVFQNLWDPERAFTAFWTHFDLFRSGEPPDALTPTAMRMFESNPDLNRMSDSEVQEHKRRLNRIFYTE